MTTINNEDYIVLPGGGIGKWAKYLPQMLPEYKDNPVIEALPPIMSQEEVTDYLLSYPAYSNDERKLDPHIRMHAVMRVFDYFQPWGRHFDLEQRFSIAIRQGYKHRNPNNPLYVGHLQKNYHELKSGKMFYNHADQLDNKAFGFTIMGFSGIGKTKAIDRVLSMYSQIIVHTEYKSIPLNFYQITWLKMECPHDGSIKGLCCNFFQAIDRLLGTSYYKENGAGGWAVNRMMPGMRQVAQNHYLGMLIVDEIQCLSQAKSGGASEMLNFFVGLVNSIGVPVILIGTTKALPILQGEFRQARRGSGIGDMVWEPMRNDGIWNLLMKGAWKYQWTKTKVEISDEFLNLLYDESQGILDIAIKLYAIAQFRTIALGKEEILTEDIIRKVAKDSLRLVRPALEALRSGNQERIAQFSDITSIDIQDYFDKYYSELQASMAQEQSNVEINGNYSLEKSYRELVSKLIEFEIDLKIAEKVAKRAIGQLADKYDFNKAFKKAYKLAIEVENNFTQNEKKSRPKGIDDANDIRYIGTQAKIEKRPAYEYLYASNYIKDPLRDLQINME
ncbi:ATP-binding protein [Sporomusa acidovorans]|uniref:ATP-binding protein n=1 Tax=Sporomusa acidovorans TaxID=112900 RepID=UPI00088E5624|nr:ATP-binding protein [Sporomusa acidovorans]OZC18943.1 transposon Tn7 transposition protein TnsC [Sporomusa acidovorans DSM 3132]SDD69865.1 AAA domain-containing protein [Sporomusa acidovorans]